MHFYKGKTTQYEAQVPSHCYHHYHRSRKTFLKFSKEFIKHLQFEGCNFNITLNEHRIICISNKKSLFICIQHTSIYANSFIYFVCSCCFVSRVGSRLEQNQYTMEISAKLQSSSLREHPPPLSQFANSLRNTLGSLSRLHNSIPWHLWTGRTQQTNNELCIHVRD